MKLWWRWASLLSFCTEKDKWSSQRFLWRIWLGQIRECSLLPLVLPIPLVHFSVHTIQGMLWAWVLTEQKRAMSMSLFSQGPIKHSNLKGRLTKKKSTLVSVSVGLLQHNSPQNSCENHSKKLWIIYQFSPCHFRHRLMWMRRALANVLVMKAMISFLYNTIHLYL